MRVIKTAGRWLTPQGWITGYCSHDTQVQSVDAAVLPAAHSMFIPAPVDLHVHGGGGFDCMHGEDALRGMLRSHARYGTGALLATSVTATVEDTSRFIECVLNVMDVPEANSTTLLGAHLEGPFISPQKMGAQPPFAQALDIAQLESWLQSEIVRVITYAPELDPEQKVMALCERYAVRAQIGHTNCTWSQAQAALLGGCGITHLYNAMSGVAHRQSGAAAAALAWADYAEIITDGYHVDFAAFAAARRAIPHLYSVTDATAAMGMPDGEYKLGSLSVVKNGYQVCLPDGTIAGSCLTQLRSIEVLRDWGYSWEQITDLISTYPADWIRDSRFGVIKQGAFAHWLEITDDQPSALWLYGGRRPFSGTNHSQEQSSGE